MEKPKLQVLICDDDPVCINVNKAYVESYSAKFHREVVIYEVLGTGDIQKQMLESIDIAFLDIDLKDGNGFDIAKALQQRNARVPIIFVSSHREYTEDACDILAMGYLKKPIIQSKFERVFERAIIQAEVNRNAKNVVFLRFTENHKEVSIKMSDVISVEKVLKKVVIKTKYQKTYEVTDTMKNIESKLSKVYLRVNQSVIVNKREIMQYDRKEITMSTGEKFVIGRTYLKKVYDNLQRSSSGK